MQRTAAYAGNGKRRHNIQDELTQALVELAVAAEGKKTGKSAIKL
jgi:hypothetical protein